MKKPLILVTVSTERMDDTPIVRLNREYVNALVKAGGVPVPVSNGFGLEELIELSDGLLLSGGVDVDPTRFGQEKLNDSVCFDRDRDELELRLIEAYRRTGKPILAICRGLQVLNVAFGGTLIQDIPTWCGANHTKTEHGVRVTAGSLLHDLTGARDLRVNSYHHQCVPADGLAAAFVPTAVWTGCGVTMIEAFEQPGYPLLAVQWHPERAYRDPEGLSDMDALFRWLVEKAGA